MMNTIPYMPSLALKNSRAIYLSKDQEEIEVVPLGLYVPLNCPIQLLTPSSVLKTRDLYRVSEDERVIVERSCNSVQYLDNTVLPDLKYLL